MMDLAMRKPDSSPEPQAKPSRPHRRVTVAGTGPVTADGPGPRLDAMQPKPDQSSQAKQLSERDRWMLEQKPPHY